MMQKVENAKTVQCLRHDGLMNTLEESIPRYKYDNDQFVLESNAILQDYRSSFLPERSLLHNAWDYTFGINCVPDLMLNMKQATM